MADGSRTGEANERFQVVEVHAMDGNIYQGEEALDHLEEADEVFYEIDSFGETYYRWVGGPFSDVADVEAAAEDAEDVYSEAAG